MMERLKVWRALSDAAFALVMAVVVCLASLGLLEIILVIAERSR